MPKVTKLFKGYEPEAFLGQVKSLPSNEGAEVGDFINKVQKLINVLELKAYR